MYAACKGAECEALWAEIKLLRNEEPVITTDAIDGIATKPWTIANNCLAIHFLRLSSALGVSGYPGHGSRLCQHLGHTRETDTLIAHLERVD